VSDKVNEDLRREHARDHEGRVDDAGGYHAHALNPVEAALQAAQPLEGVEVEEEGDADY